MPPLLAVFARARALFARFFLAVRSAFVTFVPMKRIELLAPAKDYAAAVAAVDYGADALYIGGSRFGARRAATNSVEEIRRVVEYAHRYGVRVYATMNTLLWNEELAAAEQDARALLDAGVDALIVQDMAYRRMGLDCELHASTQVQVRTPEVAKFLGEAGFTRVILERALSLESIRAIASATTAEVECFVHGAICVGYSGRCFLSRSMSSRSGNRGACSQPCRLKWSLTDGRGKHYLTDKHLLSVRDMNLSKRLGDLLDVGVTSFKIEGRLKDTDYIRNVVSYYRRALDEALKSRPQLMRASVGESIPDFTPDPAKSFTRGESEYYFDGKSRGVASFDTPKAVGEYLGKVVQCSARGYRVQSKQSLTAGDGICLLTPDGLIGTNVNTVNGEWIQPNRMERVAEGTPLYRNYDHRFHKQLAASRTRRLISTASVVSVSEAGITLRYTDCTGMCAEVHRSVALERAQQVEKNTESLRRQAMRTGDTIFRVDAVTVEGGEWFVPTSLVAEMRREALEKLLQCRIEQPQSHTVGIEDMGARYPHTTVTADENVTNRLAEQFYREHGVERIVEPLELAETTVGACVLRSAYCIRRELGECLLERSRMKGELYLETGGHRYRLDFDCKRCEMSLIDCTK